MISFGTTVLNASREEMRGGLLFLPRPIDGLTLLLLEPAINLLLDVREC
jgi:hypothetical protein